MVGSTFFVTELLNFDVIRIEQLCDCAVFKGGECANMESWLVMRRKNGTLSALFFCLKCFIFENL